MFEGQNSIVRRGFLKRAGAFAAANPLKLLLPLAPSCALLSAQPPAAPQASNTEEQRYRMFQDYLVRRAAEVTENNLSGIRDLGDWKRKRPELRSQLLDMVGLNPLPTKAPLHPRITGTFERDTYRVEKIVFESQPRFYVTGNLYLPKEVNGRLPTVLYLCGHAPSPAGAKIQYQHHGIWLARHGYVAFLIDTIEFGEISGIHHGTHDLEKWYWLSLGYTPAGPEIWNAMRALDYLETRSEVDPKRMAVTGISGGGAMTWYTAALDDRVQAAAPVCSTWSVQSHTALDAVQENCDCIYFINTFLADLPLVGALIAPRPLKIISASRDVSFPAAGYHDVYRRSRAIYDLYGAGARVQEYDYPSPHMDILQFRKEADEWLGRWLNGDRAPFDEGKIEREDASHLKVLDHRPGDAINEGIDKLFIPTHSMQDWKTLAAWTQRRTELLGELKEKVFRAFPKSNPPFNGWKKAEDGWVTRYADAFHVEFTTEQGVRVNGQLFIPRDNKKSHPALIYVKRAEDIVYPIDYDVLLSAFESHVVLVLRPRAVDYPADRFRMATIKRTAALIGATLESMQIWDILRSVDYLSESEGLKLSGISIYGRKEMGALGLYAAALDDRISRVILDDPPATHWQGPALLNVLRITDLPEAAALVASREIVSLTQLPQSYAYTSSVYALFGKENQIHAVDSLGDALRVWES
ncbi:MAG TPA: acetylxylan esterase [Bryobacteraceae bacterium]|nr:acetylxylan esterase [Bryobacteraceae bacterium]